MTRYNNKRQTVHGFSLIELVVVIAIIMIMTALLLTVGAEDRTKRALQTASRQVAAGLREAQTRALNGSVNGTQYPCDFTFDLGGGSYDIRFSYYDPDPDSTSFTKDDGDGQINCQDKVEDGVAVSGVALPKGVTATDSASITFDVPHGVPYDESGKLKDSKPFVLQSDNLFYAVCLSPSGRVDEVGAVEDKNDAQSKCDNL